MWIESNVIGLSSHLLWHFSLLKDFRSELGAFFGVLEDGRHFDGAGPVDVVEALAEDELLKCLLLQLALTVDHAVVIGHSGAPVGLLTYDEKVVFFTHHSFAHQCAGRHVPKLALLYKESLAVLDVYHHGRDGDCSAVDLLNSGYQTVEVEFVIDGDLITSAAVQEENYLVRRILVSIGVSVEARQRQFDHRLELLLRLGEDFAVGVEGGEGRVDGGSSCQHSPLLGRRGVEGQEHRPGDLSEGLRHPEGVAPLGDDLEEDFGGDALQILLPEGTVSDNLGEHTVQ